jgi:hypothetical protein
MDIKGGEMTDTELEDYLRQYYYANNSINKLTVDLISEKSKRQEVENTYPGFSSFVNANKKSYRINDPTYQAARVAVDVYGRREDMIKKALLSAQCVVESLAALVDKAGLDGLEKEYIRFRYFENRSQEWTCMKLGGRHRSSGARLRKRAFNKIKPLLEG